MPRGPSFLSRYSLGARLAMLTFGLAALAVAVYGSTRIGRRGGDAMILAKTSILSKNMTNLADSLATYYQNAGQFIPMTLAEGLPTVDYVRWGARNELLFDSYAEAAGLEDLFAGDPDTYLRYWTDGQAWTIWSMGPDGDYDLSDPAVYGAPGQGAANEIGPYMYFPQNGVRSSGDIVKIYRPAPEE